MFLNFVVQRLDEMACPQRFVRGCVTGKKIVLDKLVDAELHLLRTYSTLPKGIRVVHHIDDRNELVTQKVEISYSLVVTIPVQKSGDVDAAVSVGRYHYPNLELMELPNFDDWKANLIQITPYVNDAFLKEQPSPPGFPKSFAEYSKRAKEVLHIAAATSSLLLANCSWLQSVSSSFSQHHTSRPLYVILNAHGAKSVGTFAEVGKRPLGLGQANFGMGRTKLDGRDLNFVWSLCQRAGVYPTTDCQFNLFLPNAGVSLFLSTQ